MKSARLAVALLTLAACSPRSAKQEPPVPVTPEEVLAIKGDPVNGRIVYRSDTSGCFKCHAFQEEGGDVGPDLTAIHQKYDAGEILYNILEPSAAIGHDYEAWLIKTKSGRIHSGIIMGDGDQLILQDSSGKLIYVEQDKIAVRKKLEKSIMPDNVAMGLTARQLADLLAYLMTGVE